LAVRRQRQQLLGEELRLLYVAMTRARDRLILTGTAQRLGAEEWEADMGRTFDNREISKAQSALDWMLLWLPSVTKVEELGADDVSGAWLRWRICRADPVLPASSDKAGEAVDAPVVIAGTVLDEVMERIHWRYPHALAMEEPAKTTVTALRRRALVDEEARPWEFVQSGRSSEVRPVSDLSASELGTLHHEFLQLVNLEQTGDEQSLRQQVAQLVAAGVFTAAEGAALDVAALAEFWRSEVGSAIRAKAACVRRELPFTARFTPVELARHLGTNVLSGLADEFVVVQGVADLVVVQPQEIWLLDFKTDHVDGPALASRVAKYRPQLALYAAALAGIFQRPVTRRWLHFLRARQTLAV
jgi:ATP-dependent helicase/nuclease subunit A